MKSVTKKTVIKGYLKISLKYYKKFIYQIKTDIIDYINFL